MSAGRGSKKAGDGRSRARPSKRPKPDVAVPEVREATPSSSAAPTHGGSNPLVAALTGPAGTAAAGAASFVGLLLALAPLLGSSTVLAAIGLPTFAWGIYQLVFKERGLAIRIAGAIGFLVVASGVGLLITQQVAKPEAIEFFYDGGPLAAPEDSPLAGEAFPPLTDDPATGVKVDSLFGAADLPVSCWVEGRYKGEELLWVSIVDGEYRTLWVPYSSLGAMGRGAVRALLPCSNWRWRIQELP